MDWDLPGTREATILTHFINGPAQACVVEVMPKGDNYYWEYDGKNPLAITNHEPDDEEFEDDGDDKNGWTDSIPRLKKITELSKKCKSKKR